MNAMMNKSIIVPAVSSTMTVLSEVLELKAATDKAAGNPKGDSVI